MQSFAFLLSLVGKKEQDRGVNRKIRPRNEVGAQRTLRQSSSKEESLPTPPKATAADGRR
jgi:hypothetical protein